MNQTPQGNNPIVSIVVPIHNNEKTLAQAIDSILAQSFTNWELLLINDGSTDDSAAIASSYDDPRIRFVSLDATLGLAAVLNKSLLLAKAPFIARQDADDWSHPKRIEQQMLYLLHHPNVSAVGSGSHYVNETGESLYQVEPPNTPDSLLWQLAFVIPFCGPTLMFRKEQAIEVGGMGHLDYFDDYNFVSKLAQHGHIACISQALYFYRQHPQQMTQQHPDKTRQAVMHHSHFLWQRLFKKAIPSSAHQIVWLSIMEKRPPLAQDTTMASTLLVLFTKTFMDAFCGSSYNHPLASQCAETVNYWLRQLTFLERLQWVHHNKNACHWLFIKTNPIWRLMGLFTPQWLISLLLRWSALGRLQSPPWLYLGKSAAV